MIELWFVCSPCVSRSGVGAGMYVDATEAPWSVGYKMYTYVTQELPAIIEANFPVDAKRQSIMGHSMGGMLECNSIRIRIIGRQNEKVSSSFLLKAGLSHSQVMVRSFAR